jgi:hypothetical protein
MKLNDKMNLNLESMLRFASLYTPSTNDPTFFMPEILNNTRESFSSVDPRVLYTFVDQACFRMSQDHFIFEHLHASHSKIHTHFKPYTEVSFHIFRRITDELLKDKTPKNMQILAKMYSCEHVTKNIFKTESEIKDVFEQIVKGYEVQDMNTQNWHDLFDFLG